MMALKETKPTLLVGHKTRGRYYYKSFSDLKKIKNAARRYIEDLWDEITDGEIDEKETAEGKEEEEVKGTI